MLTHARFVLMVPCIIVMLAAPAFAQSAAGGQNLQLRAVQIDLSQPSRGAAPAAATEVPRHFADPQLLREIKTAYASSKPQPAKPHQSSTATPTPIAVGSPAPIWTPGATPTPASMSAPFAAMGEFDGGGYEPPDTFVAAGTVGSSLEVVEAVNLMAEIEVGPNAGTLLNFAVCTPSSSDSVSDPRVLFDSADARWMISTVTFAPISDAGWNLLVSATDDPTGGWYCLHIPTSGIKNPDGSTGNFPDFPKLGFNSNKIVLTGDAFSTIQRRFTTSYKFQGTEFVVINKSELINGAVNVDVTPFNPPQGDFAIEPAQQLTPTGVTTSDPDVLYMASVNSAASSTGILNLWQVTGVPSPSASASANKTALAIATISTPPNAQQLGSGVLIDTNDDSLLDAVFRDGSPGFLWVSANDACVPPGDNSTRSCARLIEVSIKPGTFAIAQDFDVSAGPGTYLYYPAVRTDMSGNVVTVFSGSAASAASLSPGYPSAYTGVQKVVGNNSLTNFSMVWAGDTAYAVSPPRWGDYSGAGVDPGDTAVWVAGEYGTSFSFFGPIWGTAITKVTP